MGSLAKYVLYFSCLCFALSTIILGILNWLHANSESAAFALAAIALSLGCFGLARIVEDLESILMTLHKTP